MRTPRTSKLFVAAGAALIVGGANVALAENTTPAGTISAQEKIVAQGPTDFSSARVIHREVVVRRHDRGFRSFRSFRGDRGDRVRRGGSVIRCLA